MTLQNRLAFSPSGGECPPTQGTDQGHVPAHVPRPHEVVLMGTRLDNLDEAEVVGRIISAIRDGRGGCVITPNVDLLLKISRSTHFADVVSRAALVVADGMPLVWASRLQRTPLKARVNGTQLVRAMAQALAGEDMSMFLLGAAPGVAEQAAAVLRARAPGLRIAGTLAPPMGFESDPAQLRNIVSSLRGANPHFVVCAFGSPKQEQLMDSWSSQFPSTWFIGAGSALTIISGATPAAPEWMRRNGLEWFHRLRLEPRRLFTRYIVDDLPFVVRMLFESARSRVRNTAPGPDSLAA